MRRYKSLFVRLAAATFVASTVAGCTGGETFQRGYIVDERAVSQVKKGMSGEQVLTTLGTPSTVSTVGNKSWYYISQTVQPDASSSCRNRLWIRQVTAVYFDNEPEGRARRALRPPGRQGLRLHQPHHAVRRPGIELPRPALQGREQLQPVRLTSDQAVWSLIQWPGPSRPFLSRSPCSCVTRWRRKNPAASNRGVFVDRVDAAVPTNAPGWPAAAGR